MAHTNSSKVFLNTNQKDACEKLEDCINKGNRLKADFKVNSNKDEVSKQYKIWNEFNAALLSKIFSDESIQAEYNTSSAQLKITRSSFDEIENKRRSLQAKLNSLESIQNRLKLGLFEVRVINLPNHSITTQSQSKIEVFVIHGHDFNLKNEVAKVVENMGLKPIILHEQPNQGHTIIEKLEKHASKSNFAIALLTPDDMGYSKDNPTAAKLRARQNVILELGLFIGLLGRSNVCALVKGDIEWPSDLLGIIHLKVDDSKDWEENLVKELKAAKLLISKT